MEKVYIRFSKTYVVDQETADQIVEDVNEREIEAINDYFLDNDIKPHVTVADFDIDDDEQVHQKVENHIQGRKEFIKEMEEEGYSEEEIEFALMLNELMG